jgi:hypothetical protein
MINSKEYKIYKHYVRWCKSLGIKPESFKRWMKRDEALNEQY